jgi:hypothetical protein
VQATGKLYHLRSESSAPFCNLQSRARTHAVLVIGLYELLGNDQGEGYVLFSKKNILIPNVAEKIF